jgi:hypothetical protein
MADNNIQRSVYIEPMGRITVYCIYSYSTFAYVVSPELRIANAIYSGLGYYCGVVYYN